MVAGHFGRRIQNENENQRPAHAASCAQPYTTCQHPHDAGHHPIMQRVEVSIEEEEDGSSEMFDKVGFDGEGTERVAYCT